jgi:16S rRNA (adenine1518-N6/adenine1519-N6)-dimethyltransferase
VHGQFPNGSRARLRALGLRPNKRLSQSFLEDDRVAAAIVRAAGLSPRSDVLEVGPGLGILTRRLLRAARKVVAVEIDASLAARLEAELGSPSLRIVQADILGFDVAAFFEEPYVVVANLPYHITSPALRYLLGAGPPFALRLVVMVQAEVAARIAARPGDLSALGVAIQAQSRVRSVRQVPSAAFYPRPKVDSTVLLLEPFDDVERPIPRSELADFVSLVQAGFKQPRKTLGNSLADGLASDRREAVARLESAGIDPTLRPQALGVDDWVRLFYARAAQGDGAKPTA